MIKRILIVAGVSLLASGCELLDQVRQLQMFTKCEFRLVSVEDTRLAGFGLTGRTSIQDFGVLGAVKFKRAVSAGTLPLEFTLNIEVKNPNAETAAMNRLAWILLVDGIEMTRGQVEERVEIGPNGVSPMALAIAFDLREVLAEETLDAMLNLAFNVAGEGSRPTRITLKAKPSILISGQPMDFPDYITVTTEFGGTAGSR